jgi:DinB superfamily
MTQSEILLHLETELRAVLEEVRQIFPNLNEQTLRRRPANPKRWNILECFDHLNRSYTDYLPEIEHAIHKAKARSRVHQPDAAVKYTWLGKEAVRWAASTGGKKFKTAKRYNPIGQDIPVSAVKSFIINTEKTLRLIQMSKEVDINQARVRFAVIPFLKYRLANLLEFIVAHTRRHVNQARQLLSEFQ